MSDTPCSFGRPDARLPTCLPRCCRRAAAPQVEGSTGAGGQVHYGYDFYNASFGGEPDDHAAVNSEEAEVRLEIGAPVSFC